MATPTEEGTGAPGNTPNELISSENGTSFAKPASRDSSEASVAAVELTDDLADLSIKNRFWKVCDAGVPNNGGRIHTCVEGRYVTVFRYHGKLSCIDSVCHHAGGPLTDGPIQDIEELGISVVLCPWHKFMVSIDDGLKAFQGIDIINGVPVPSGANVLRRLCCSW
jgi:nitrite reductase/ring-hydroxylating ferredoxin subunit